MIVVVDTNVLVSAFLGPGGAGREVLRRALQRRLEPLMGAALFAEYESVLARDALFERCVLSATERDQLLDDFLSVCRWTRVYYTWRPNVPDESDNHLVELAVAGGAQAIVTKNVRDFARMELRFPNLRVATPADLVKE
jgi:putative PIN family toxin of toxin-antitoxin system